MTTTNSLTAAKAEKFYHRAKQLFAEDSNNSFILERVLKDIMKAMSLNPNTIKHYLFLSRVYRSALDLTSAVACLRFILRIEPGNYVAKKKLSDILVLRGQEMICEAFQLLHSDNNAEQRSALFKAAKIAFDEALHLGRNDTRVYIFKIVCLVRLGQKKEALETITRIVGPFKSGQHHPEVFILRAKIMWAHGLVEEGNKDIRYSASLLPKHPEVLAYTVRSYEKAEKLYELSIQAFGMKKYKDALRYATYAASICAEDVKLHLLISKIYRMKDDLQAAYAAVQKATVIFQSHSDFDMELPHDIVRQTNLIFNEMALKFAGEGQFEKAVALWNKVIASEKILSRGLTDVDFRFYLNRGDCYRLQHKLAQALIDYKAAAALHPLDWDIRTKISLTHYMHGMDFFNASNFIDAEKEFGQAIESNPKVSEYYASRGKARYYCADFKGSYEDYKMVIELNPANDEVRLRLEQFEQELGLEGTTTLTGKQQYATSSSAARENQQRAHSPVKLPVLGQPAVKVKPDDLVVMMLNPHGARNLPPILVAENHKQVRQSIESCEADRRDAEGRFHSRIKASKVANKFKSTRTIVPGGGGGNTSTSNQKPSSSDGVVMKSPVRMRASMPSQPAATSASSSSSASRHPKAAPVKIVDPAARARSPSPPSRSGTGGAAFLNQSKSAEILVPIQSLALAEVGKSEKRLQEFFETKLQVKKGDLWKIMKDAERMAKAASRPEKGHAGANKMPTTLSGLKRMSQMLSQRAAKLHTAVVEGVHAPHKILHVGKHHQVGVSGDVDIYELDGAQHNLSVAEQDDMRSISSADALLSKLVVKKDASTTEEKASKRKKKKEKTEKFKFKLDDSEGDGSDMKIVKLLEDSGLQASWDYAAVVDDNQESMLLATQEMEIAYLMQKQLQEDEERAKKLETDRVDNLASKARLAARMQQRTGVNEEEAYKEMDKLVKSGGAGFEDGFED